MSSSSDPSTATSARSSGGGSGSSRGPKFDQGQRNGVKACVEWLLGQAEKMSDPHAKAILNFTAHDMGLHFKRSDPSAATASPAAGSDQAREEPQ